MTAFSTTKELENIEMRWYSTKKPCLINTGQSFL